MPELMSTVTLCCNAYNGLWCLPCERQTVQELDMQAILAAVTWLRRPSATELWQTACEESRGHPHHMRLPLAVPLEQADLTERAAAIKIFCCLEGATDSQLHGMP